MSVKITEAAVLQKDCSQDFKCPTERLFSTLQMSYKKTVPENFAKLIEKMF